MARRGDRQVGQKRLVFFQDLIDAPLVEEGGVEEVEARFFEQPQAGMADTGRRFSALRVGTRL